MVAVAVVAAEDIAEADSLGLLEDITEADSPAPPVEQLPEPQAEEYQPPVMPSGPHLEVVAVEDL